MLKKLIFSIGILLLSSQLQAANLSSTSCPGTGCVDFNVASAGSIGIQITGTWVGTITFRGSVDGTNYVDIDLIPIADTTGVSTTTANGVWNGSIAGLSKVRVIFTSRDSGTAVVTYRTTLSAKSNGGSGGGINCSGASNTQILFLNGTDCDGTADLTYTDATHVLQYSPTYSMGVVGSDQAPFKYYPTVTVTANNVSRSITGIEIYQDTEESGGARNIAGTYGISLGNDDYLTGTRNRVFGSLIQAYQNGGTVNGSGYYGGTVGESALAVTYGTSVTNRLIGHQSQISSFGTSTATIQSNYYAVAPTNAAGVTVPVLAAFYAQDIGSVVASNKYYSWYDSRGVGRCKDDNTFNSVYQTICTVYNPQFAKYVAGATNYERIIYGQFSSNRAQIGTEAGGSGTLRAVDLIGANFSVVSALSPTVADTGANTCGTGTETITGNDNAGKVTIIGSAGTSCTVTFATAFTNAPSCIASNETTAALARATSTNTTVILAGVFAQNDVIAFACIGR